ncbi:hypothetical protein BDV93DRAFT_553845 [Ceratobasidium sp. AG-I]|nr:hypothetical protein BDV93DRAFT_553845 [Ceratobasidium sp. AG-I]
MPVDCNKPVNLPIHEQRANRAKAKALAKTPATVSTPTANSQSAAPQAMATSSSHPGMTTRSKCGAVEMTYYLERLPQRVFCWPQVKQIPVPSLPGQEDIPGSDDKFFSWRPTHVSKAPEPRTIQSGPVEPAPSGMAASEGCASAFAGDTNEDDHFATTNPNTDPFGPSCKPQNEQHSALPATALEVAHILPLVNANPFDFSNNNWNHLMFGTGAGKLGGLLGAYPHQINTQGNASSFNNTNTSYPISVPNSNPFHSVRLPASINPVQENNQPLPLLSQSDFEVACMFAFVPVQQPLATPGAGSLYNPDNSLAPVSGQPAVVTVLQPSALPCSEPFPTQPQTLALPNLDPAAGEEDLSNIARVLDQAESRPAGLASQEFTPARRFGSRAQLGSGARVTPCSQRGAKKDSSKTPGRKIMLANIATHYSVNHGRRYGQAAAQAQVPEENQPADTAGGSQINFSLAKHLLVSPMRKYIAFYREIDMNFHFRSHLKNKSSAVRRELVNEVLGDIKTLYNVWPSTTACIDKLIEDDGFLYTGEDVVSLKKRGFCGHPALVEVICGLLFEHPANLGTLFMDELCQEDPPHKWHKKLKDLTATKGVSIGLIVFAAIAILHMLECICDRTPSGRKPYKFEQTRYSQTWTRYHKMLVGYRYLGEWRLQCLTTVKQCYNQNNRVGDGSNADLTDCGDSSDVGSNGTGDLDDAGCDLDAMDEDKDVSK